MVAGNSACQFSKVGLVCQGCIYPKKCVSAYKIGGKVGVHSKILDFFV